MENYYMSKEKLKYLSKLSQKKYRHAERKVLVEGKNIIEQLYQNGILPLELYIRKDGSLSFDPGDVEIFQLSESEMRRICDTEQPQNLAAMYSIPETKETDFRVALYLDGISDPGNMGTIIRSAAAFGVKQIFLSEGSCDPFSPKVLRSSLGAVFWIPIAMKTARELCSYEAKIISTDLHNGIPLQDFDLNNNEKIILAIGSEAHGVSSEIQNISSAKIRIDQSNTMESLNASVACGIILWWFFVKADDCN